MGIDNEQLRVATLEFILRSLVAKVLEHTPGPDLTHHVLSALDQLAPSFAAADIDPAEVRARMRAQADAILSWAMDESGIVQSPIKGRPLSETHYRDWR
ncbi:hypothetical protein BTE77_18980 [Ensifer adhaerens]|nr:hypothetical protein BTE77_18980 [Ensifer adhaerens]